MTSILLGKRYEIIEQIDSGGMAEIYRAVCKKTNKIVALKVLKDKFSDNSDYVHRFKREAETVLALEHENIVSVTDVGYDGGVYYIVMEFIEGLTLKNIIEKDGRINESEAVQYAIQLCSALSAAHKKGIIHRDIKPHNILIDYNKRVKLTDFGIAKSISSVEEQENKVIGSVHYISPEQVKGERIDSRSDIYSLGIVLYEMVTGVLPHTGGKTVSVALKHINEQITPPAEVSSDISSALNYIILKATSKNKKDRYQSVSQLKNDLVRSVTDPEGNFLDIGESANKPFIDPLILKKKNLFWKAGMLVLLFGVICSALVLIIKLFDTPNSSFVVPDLVGANIESAEKRISMLNVNTFYAPSESAEEGTIISQSPEAGSSAASKEAINLTISSGPAELVMPDFNGMTLEEAQAQIEAMGLTLGKDNIIYVYQPNVAPGSVISQIPEAGETITEDDILSITISGESAEEGAPMPELKDSSVDQAVSLLNDMGFKNCYIYEDDSVLAPGTVLRQSPEVGIETALTENIYISISGFKDKKYTGSLYRYINIPEKGSKLIIVLEDSVDGKTVNFIIDETTEESGQKYIELPSISSLTPGKKAVTVFINNIKVGFYEVDFS